MLATTKSWLRPAVGNVSHLFRGYATAPEFKPGQTRIGWIGTGVMGKSMCEHLIKKGFSLAICTRTPAKARPLEQLGAIIAHSPADVAELSDVVISMVGFPSDVREVYFGKKGILTALKPGGVVIDMTVRALYELIIVDLRQ
eukprot:Colp12_sorted_trinity150504_noHs@12338